MGWKCPGCRNHVYGGSSVCPTCDPDKATLEATEPTFRVSPDLSYFHSCQICGRGGRGVEIHGHHVSYHYNIIVPLCDRCHGKVHFDDDRDANDNHAELDRLDPLRAM